MTQMRRVWLDALALWSALPPAAGNARPAPALLAANERRRAPDSVLLALEVASAALARSGRDAQDVATVFASAHGDLPITDALCKTLAADPTLLSPTRFHHSVHNAASGYWAIGSGSAAASTALAASESTFATGLLEALALCAADGQPVMLVAYDTEATGALRSVNTSRGLLALAVVLAPSPAGPGSWALDWSTGPGAVAVPAVHTEAARALQANASSPALPLAEAWTAGRSTTLAWPLSATLQLSVCLSSPASAGRTSAAA